jgi:hypothetical protein
MTIFRLMRNAAARLAALVVAPSPPTTAARLRSTSRSSAISWPSFALDRRFSA